jgi:outer membrane protein TolC
MKGPAYAAAVLLMGILAPGMASAGQATLDSLIELAKINNPELTAAQYQTTAAEQQAKAAGALPDPQIGLAAMNLPRSSFAFDETPMTGVQVGLTQMIPWPGKLGDRAKVARSRHKMSGAASRAVENSVERQVSEAYYEYAYWYAARASIARSLDLARAISTVAETRYANGEVSAQDLLRSQTSVQRLEVRLLRAGQHRQTALLKLINLTHSPGLDTTLTASMPELPDGIGYTVEVTGNPELERASYGIETASAKAELAESAYYPDFSIGVDYRFRRKVPGDPVAGEDFLTFRAGFSLPLWFFSKQRHQSAAAKQMVRSAKANRQAVELRLRQQVDDARQRYRTTTESLRRYDTDILPQARAAFEAAEIAYEVGKVDFNALLSAQLELLEVELERLELIKQAHQTLARLDELTGAGEDK